MRTEDIMTKKIYETCALKSRLALLPVEVAQLHDLPFEVGDVLVELGHDGALFVGDLLAQDDVGADLDGGKRIVELVAHRHHEFLHRFGGLPGEKLLLLGGGDPGSQLTAFDDVDDRAGENRIDRLLLDEIILDAVADRLDRHAEIAVRRQQNDRDAELFLENLAGEVDAGRSAQEVIKQYEVVAPGGTKRLERLLRFGDPGYLELVILERTEVMPDDIGIPGVIVDQQYPKRGGIHECSLSIPIALLNCNHRMEYRREHEALSP